MNSVGRNSVIMASGTAASRVTGQIRTILLAAAIGTTGIAADAYQTGAMIPQVMFTLISGGIFNAVLVPQIVRTLKEKDATDRLNKLITASMILLAILTLILMLATPVLTSIYLNSKWNPAQRALANSFTLWCMPQVFFYGLYTVLGQILAAKGRFTAYAWSSVGANLVSCIGFLIFILLFGNAQKQPVTFWDNGKVALTAGAWSLGVAFQALILFIPLIMSGFRYRPSWGLRGMGLRSMGSVAAWSLGVVLIDQLANVVNARITNGAPLEGNPFDIAGNGSYQNAYTLFILPYSLIAVSVSTAIFPRLSKSVSEGKIDAARDELSRSLRNVGLIMFFFSSVMLAIPVPITRALLPSVGIHEAVLISGPLLGLSLGLVAMSAFLLIQRTFYAFEDGFHPFVFAAVSNTIQVVLVLVAIRLASPKYWTTLVGVSLALSNIFSFPILARMLRKPFRGYLDGRRILTTYAKALAACLLALASALLIKTPVTHLVGAWVEGSQGHMSWIQAIFICCLITLVAAAVYTLVLIALRTTEFTEMLNSLTRRLRGKALRKNQNRIPESQSPAQLMDEPTRVVHSSSPDSTLAGLDAALENLEERGVESDGDTAIDKDRGNSAADIPVRIIPRKIKETGIPKMRVIKSTDASSVTPPGAVHQDQRNNLHESSRAMKLHIGDTILGRYTLITLLRRSPGLSAWRAKDKVLDRDCQLFIVNDSSSTDRINSTASGLALKDDSRFTPVYQLHTRDGISLIVTAPDAGMSIHDYMQGPAGEILSYQAIRTILGETSEAMRSLNRMGTTKYPASTRLIRLSEASVTLADSPVAPMIQGPETAEVTTGEEAEIQQLASILYSMLTKQSVQPENTAYDLASLPEDAPEEFRIICERGLNITNEEGVKPVPLVTLAELSALLSPWVKPEELTKKDLIWPDLDGRASIETVELLQVDPSHLLPLPQELTQTPTSGSALTQHLPHWGTNQLLFPGRNEVEMLNPRDSNTDLFSLFDERKQLQLHRQEQHRTAPLDVSALRTTPPVSWKQEESKEVTGRMPLISPDGDSGGIQGTDRTRENPVEQGFTQWDFHRPGQDENSSSPGRTEENSTGDNTQGEAEVSTSPAEEPTGSTGSATSSQVSRPGQAPVLPKSQTSQSGSEEPDGEDAATRTLDPLPPSFTPEIHSLPAPITYGTEEDHEGEDTLEDGDMADTHLFGHFTTRSVVIFLAVLIVVVALIWALSTVAGGHTHGSKEESGWPVMSNVPFPGHSSQETQEGNKTGDTNQAEKAEVDRTVGKVPSPPKPKNTTAYDTDRQIFLNKPAGLQGFGWYVHLTEPREVSRLEISIPQSGGHAQIFANSTATQPNQGQALADFSFDPSGTTQVTLPTPVTTQDLVIWVPMDGMPGNTLHFNSVKVY